MLFWPGITEAYTEPCQTSKFFFAQIVNDFQPLTIFIKNSILDVWQCFEDTSEVRQCFSTLFSKMQSVCVVINYNFTDLGIFNDAKVKCLCKFFSPSIFKLFILYQFNDFLCTSIIILIIIWDFYDSSSWYPLPIVNCKHELGLQQWL